MNLKENLILAVSLFSCAAEGLVQFEPISRAAVFPTMSGQKRVDLTTYDPSLVRIVDPIPISTLVEVLKLSSDSTLGNLKAALSSVRAGVKVYAGRPYEVRAQDYYNRLLQDWMPMNEAESAAAKYLLSLTSCAIRNTKEMGGSVTACQYHGTKILSDIINRLAVIHNLLTSGTIDTVAGGISKPELFIHPTELGIQMANIVKLFADGETTRILGIVSPNLGEKWRTICANVSNKSYKIYQSAP